MRASVFKRKREENDEPEKTLPELQDKHIKLLQQKNALLQKIIFDLQRKLQASERERKKLKLNLTDSMPEESMQCESLDGEETTSQFKVRN